MSKLLQINTSSVDILIFLINPQYITHFFYNLLVSLWVTICTDYIIWILYEHALAGEFKIRSAGMLSWQTPRRLKRRLLRRTGAGASVFVVTYANSV